jgi:hypothetical protein
MPREATHVATDVMVELKLNDTRSGEMPKAVTSALSDRLFSGLLTQVGTADPLTWSVNYTQLTSTKAIGPLQTVEELILPRKSRKPLRVIITSTFRLAYVGARSEVAVTTCLHNSWSQFYLGKIPLCPLLTHDQKQELVHLMHKRYSIAVSHRSS